MSVDGKVSEELLSVRTVEQIPVAVSCIPQKEDISNWSHLRDNLQQLSQSDIGLIIGLKEKPTLFIPLESRSGGSGEAVRYSLGWTVMGPMSGVRDSEHCSVNLVGLGNKEFYIDESSIGRMDKPILFIYANRFKGIETGNDYSWIIKSYPYCMNCGIR